MEIKELTSAEFWPLFEQWRPVVFSDSLYFYSRDVRTPHEISQADFLRSGMAGRYELHLAIFDGEELVGWSSSFQVSPGELYMMNSAVMPKYRKQGHYKRLMQKVVEKAKELGYQQITSQHLASNNDVIIPKLKAGFNIVGTEISDQWGVFVKLSYFINPMRKDMYEFRSGSKRLTPEMEAVFAKYLPK
jgi:ribosomal protein S18 acetylase RimI-like enzyme